MAIKHRLTQAATLAYSASATVSERISIPQRWLWGMFLRLSGTLNVTVAGTTVSRNPGTLLDVRVQLNQSWDLFSAHWYSAANERALLNDLLRTEQAVDGTVVAAQDIESVIYVPFAHPWLRSPSDTVLDMLAEQRIDVYCQWQTEDAVVNGGTKAWTTEPTVETLLVTSDEAPPGSAQGYAVQREIEASGLGVAANADLNIVLPYGAEHTYLGMVLGSMDVVAVSGRALVGTDLNQVRFSVSGGPGSIDAVRASGALIQSGHRTTARSFDIAQTGIYPVSFLGGAAGGTIGQAVSTADASDVRIRIDHDAYTTDGVILAAYDTYVPRG